MSFKYHQINKFKHKCSVIVIYEAIKVMTINLSAMFSENWNNTAVPGTNYIFAAIKVKFFVTIKVKNMVGKVNFFHKSKCLINQCRDYQLITCLYVKL